MADILKEIQTEIKEEKFERMFIHHGPKLIIIAVLIVVVTFFYSFYKKQQYIGNSEAGNIFYDAYSSAKTDLYQKVFHKEHSAFNALSNLQIAGINLSKDKYQESQTSIQNILSDKTADKAFLEIAELNNNVVTLKNPSADKTNVEKSLKNLAVNSIFKHTAKEFLASYYIEKGRVEEAKNLLNGLVQDSTTPLSIKERAATMIKIINK